MILLKCSLFCRLTEAYAPWRTRLAEPAGRHWAEDLPFSFDPPAGWGEAPALLRALTLLDAWARADGSIAPWLAFPVILRRLGITQTALPCLVAGDPGQRFALDPRPALLKRLLKQVRRAAESGLEQLNRLEAYTLHAAASIAAEANLPTSGASRLRVLVLLPAILLPCWT